MSWYKGMSFHKGGRNRAEEVVDAGYDLAIGLVNLEAYRYSPIPDSILNALIKNLGDARALELKCILRFKYSDHETEPDAPMSQILKHVAQLAPILEEYSDVIFTLQAGFIGAWGEWNRTAHPENDDPENQAKLVSSLLECYSGIVSVRTPMFIHDMCPKFIHPSMKERLGIHNDCFLSSSTNSGTYDRPNIEYWKDYCGDLALYGGETCRVSSYIQDPSHVYSEMTRLNVSYLNSEYNQDVLNYWETAKITEMVEAIMDENMARYDEED